MISRVVLLDSNVQCSTKKVTSHRKKQKIMAHSKGKNKPTETVPQKDQMVYLLDKH